MITQPSDFDQVLSVQVGNPHLTEEDLRQGLRVVFAGRANTISSKIQEAEQLVGKVQAAGQDASGSVDLTLPTGIELYFETQDLAGLNTMSRMSLFSTTVSWR